MATSNKAEDGDGARVVIPFNVGPKQGPLPHNLWYRDVPSQMRVERQSNIEDWVVQGDGKTYEHVDQAGDYDLKEQVAAARRKQKKAKAAKKSKQGQKKKKQKQAKKKRADSDEDDVVDV